MRTAFLTALFLALFSTLASAHSYKHPHYRHYAYHRHGVINALGNGLGQDSATRQGAYPDTLTIWGPQWPSPRPNKNYGRTMFAGLSFPPQPAPVGLSADCRVAARQGGPCGCVAESYFFGRTDHVLNGHNLWLADEWRRVFPHVGPGAGTAAVWPGRHVAPVVAYSGGNTVTVADSWGTHDVSIRGLVFVRPWI